MDNDNYVYELEQALTKLLDQFEPDDHEIERYIVYDQDDSPVPVNDDLADAVDHAREVMYGPDSDD